MAELDRYSHIVAKIERHVNLYDLPKDIQDVLHLVKMDKRIRINYGLEIIDGESDSDEERDDMAYIVKLELVKDKIAIMAYFNSTGKFYYGKTVKDNYYHAKSLNTLQEVLDTYEDFVTKVYQPYKEFCDKYNIERKEVASQKNLLK